AGSVVRRYRPNPHQAARVPTTCECNGAAFGARAGALKRLPAEHILGSSASDVTTRNATLDRAIRKKSPRVILRRCAVQARRAPRVLRQAKINKDSIVEESFHGFDETFISDCDGCNRRCCGGRKCAGTGQVGPRSRLDRS